MAKPCRFCGATSGRLTNEHVWPRWLADYMPTFKEHGYSERWSSGSGRQRWREPFLAAKVRVVCAACNNGWMSAIEGAASLIVGPMVKGQAVELDAEAQAIVANWVAVKGLIATLTSKDAQPIPDYHFRRVAAAQGAPVNTIRVWIGERRDLASRMRPGEVTLLNSHFMPLTNVFPEFPIHPEIGRYRADGGVLNATIFQAGHFFALALQHDWPGLPARPNPKTKARHALLPIWPTGPDVRWPPPRAVDELGEPHKITRFLEIAPVMPASGA
jgi:hypothetical protein